MHVLPKSPAAQRSSSLPAQHPPRPRHLRLPYAPTLSSSYPSLPPSPPQYDAFLASHGAQRSHASLAEYHRRKEVFRSNLAMIRQHNAANRSFTMAMNRRAGGALGTRWEGRASFAASWSSLQLLALRRRCRANLPPSC